MRLAYLILAHDNPGQLKRLINRLNAEYTTIFVHLDKQAGNIYDFSNAANHSGNIRFIKQRVSVNWGAYSMVQATLNGLNEIIQFDSTIGYISLMSGADYPIKKNEDIMGFFLKNRGKEFLYYRQTPSPDLPLGGRDRIEYYYDYDNKAHAKNVYEIEMKNADIKRDFINGMKPYHGSQWWSITGECARYIINYAEGNKEITNFYRYAKFPDEQFFQTIIMNSPFSGNAVNDNLRYIDWSCLKGSEIDWIKKQPHPKVLTYRDFPKMQHSGKLFARKFNEKTDKAILDLIDSYMPGRRRIYV